MPVNDSAQSGKCIPGLQPLAGCDEGYDFGTDHIDLARSFVYEHLGVPKELFANGGQDCHYGNNYGHAELRGSHDAPFMRPTFASKLILKSALDTGIFRDSSLSYGFHGTPPTALKSILETQLNPSAQGAAGPGIYFSPFPLYAQLYSSSSYHGVPVYTWEHDGKTYFVDTMLMIRCTAGLSEDHDAIDEITATIGSEYMLHKLFATAGMDLENKVIARLAPEICDQLSLQGVIVKFHEKHPYKEGGEWANLIDLVKQAEAAASC